MKQIIIVTAYFIFFAPVLRAQTKLNAAPAYDNVNYEYQLKQRSSPHYLEKFALIQKDEHPHVNSTVFSGNSSPVNLKNNSGSYLKQNYLRIVQPKVFTGSK